MSVMIKAKHGNEAPRIKAVAPGDGDFVLVVTWDDGPAMRVDLTALVFGLKTLRPLRNSERFRRAKVGEWGWDVTWGDNLEVSCEVLWRLANDQANAEMTPSDFRSWLENRKLTQETAASLLGVSKRTIAYLSTGARPIDRMFALAIKGAEAELKQRDEPLLFAFQKAFAFLTEEAVARQHSRNLRHMLLCLHRLKDLNSKLLPSPASENARNAAIAASKYWDLIYGKVRIGDLPPRERDQLSAEGLKMRVLEGYVSASMSLNASDFLELMRKAEDDGRRAQNYSVEIATAIASGKAKKDDKNKQKVRVTRN